MDLGTILATPWAPKLIATVALLILVLALRAGISRMLSRHVRQVELRRRWLVNVRNSLVLIAIFGFGIIWVDELQNLGVAILGVGVAFVIAIKEFLLCINGSFLRAVTNAYSVGDRIELAGHRGDVIDLNMFATKLLEVGPGKTFHLRTGRTVIIPHSKLLDSPLVNESHMKRFVLHVFSVPLSLDEDWQQASDLLLEAATEESASYRAEAADHMQQLETLHNLDGIPVEPRVSLQIPEAGKLNLLVRVPAPVGRQGSIEQAIIRRFLAARPPKAPAEDSPS